MAHSIRGLVTVFAAIAWLASACNIDVPWRAPSTPQPREHVRAAWVAISGSQSPAWIAQEAGYFAKYGLDVELSLIEGSSRATAALLSGGVDMLEQAGPAAVAAKRCIASKLMHRSPSR